MIMAPPPLYIIVYRQQPTIMETWQAAIIIRKKLRGRAGNAHPYRLIRRPSPDFLFLPPCRDGWGGAPTILKRVPRKEPLDSNLILAGMNIVGGPINSMASFTIEC